MHGYSTVKQIVMLLIMKNCLFELAFMIFSPFSALYSASLHQDLLQQLPSCTIFDSSPLIVLSVLNSTQNCSCHSCARTVFKWREQTFWKKRGAKSRSENCVCTYSDLCISRAVMLASELWSFFISTGSLDGKNFVFHLTPSFFLGLTGDTNKRKAVIADRVSPWALPNCIFMCAGVCVLKGMASVFHELIQLTLEHVHVPLLLKLGAGF